MKRYIGIVTLTGLMVMTGCGASTTPGGEVWTEESQSEKTPEPTVTETISISALYPDYEDLNELVDESTLIIQAVVVASRTGSTDQLSAGGSGSATSSDPSSAGGADGEIPDPPGTLSTIRVTKVLLGDAEVGGELDVMQTGGVANGINFVDSQQNLLKIGQPETLMFLEKSLSSPWHLLLNATESTYTVLPGGRFQADNKRNEIAVTDANQVEQKIEQQEAMR